MRITRIEYAAECDLLNAYFANFSASSQIFFAISSEYPFSTAPLFQSSCSMRMMSSFFLPIALRSLSALPAEKPLMTMDTCMICTWYTMVP